VSSPTTHTRPSGTRDTGTPRRRTPPKSSAGKPKRLVALAALAAMVVAGLIAGNGLVSCANRPATPKAVSRPVTVAEATRLAGVRLADYTDGHSGVRITIGTGLGAVHLTGWVDWKQPLIYLNSLGVRPGISDGLVQAIPGVIAVRVGRYAPASGSDPYPAPPVPAPPTGWQIRPYALGSPIDTMVTLLFALRSASTDSAAQIAAIGTKFVGTDEIGGDPVDVMDGAAVPPPAPATPKAVNGPQAASASPSATGLPFAAQGGQVRYWVDARSRLLRAEALVNPTTPLEIDFNRADKTVPTGIELLGGAPTTPTRLTTAQARLLASMRLHDYDAKGGTITLAAPVSADQLLSGTGWLDWRADAAYLTVRNNKSSGADALVRADAAGLTFHGSIDGTGTAGTSRGPLADPSLPPPTSGWHRFTWQSRVDQGGAPDFDLILNEMLAMSSPKADDPAALKKSAARLRSDTVDGTPVTVFEIRQPSEVNVPRGYGRLRYWVDAHGLLRRLELRTRTGAYAYLTFTPGPTPTLPNPVPAAHSHP
jgi:hypothetical protein